MIEAHGQALVRSRTPLCRRRAHRRAIAAYIGASPARVIVVVGMGVFCRVIVTSAVLVSSVARADTSTATTPAPVTTPAPATTAAPAASPTAPSPPPAATAPTTAATAPTTTAPAPTFAPAAPPSTDNLVAPSNAKSPGVATALSLTPTILGLAIGGYGLYTANRDPTCVGEQVPGIAQQCTDHFPLGLNLTIVGSALLAFGPSFGHIYNGRVWTTGLKVRLSSVGVAAVGLAIAALSPHDCGEIVCAGEGIGLLVMIFGGGGTFLVGAGIDALRAHDAVVTRNSQLSVARLRVRHAPGLSVARLRTSTGSAPALVFNMSF